MPLSWKYCWTLSNIVVLYSLRQLLLQYYNQCRVNPSPPPLEHYNLTLLVFYDTRCYSLNQICIQNYFQYNIIILLLWYLFCLSITKIFACKQHSRFLDSVQLFCGIHPTDIGHKLYALLVHLNFRNQVSSINSFIKVLTIDNHIGHQSILIKLHSVCMFVCIRKF